MVETMDGIASVVEQLNERVRELEQRVAALEGRPETTNTTAAVIAAPTLQPEPPTAPEILIPPLLRPMPPRTGRGSSALNTPAALIMVIGKAVLGIAGAYLLRAIAESGTAPKLAVVAIAVLYAGAWMAWAARVHAANRFAGLTYAVTSAIILSPMLWESTVRFRVLTPAWCGVVLAAYTVIALWLAARREAPWIAWVAAVASVCTAVALIFATRDLVPLTATLLSIAAAVEIMGCLGHAFRLRVVPALAADVAVWMLVDVMSSANVMPEEYHAIAPATISALCLALVGIYGASVGSRGFGARLKITYFDMGQSALAFVLGTYGALRITRGSLAPALGVLFVVLAMACYWGALSRFTDNALARNRRVSATWAAALLVAGSWLVLPPGLEVLFLCLAAVAAAFLYSRTGKFSLGLHVSVYLVAATALSPMPRYVINALAGSDVPGAPAWSAWVVAVAAALCYATGARHAEENVGRRTLWVVPALLVGFAVAAVAVSVIVGVAGGKTEWSASRLSVARTIVGCAVALALGFVGSRWKRVELGWVAYAAVGFGTLKLLLEDLRFGNAASMVASLVFYGGVLILLPRMLQRGRSREVEVQ
jgi:hypothetical protein